MKIATNEKLFAITCQLWKEAYCHSGEELDDLKGAGDAEYDDTAFKSKWHPFGAFDCDKGYMVSAARSMLVSSLSMHTSL